MNMNDEARTPEVLKEVQHGGRHYKDMAIQPAEYSQRNRLNFCEAEAIKYLSRHPFKNGMEDVKKAMHFCQMVLEMEYHVLSSITFHDEKS